MERTKDEYKYFIVKISFKNSQLTGKLVFLAVSESEPFPWFVVTFLVDDSFVFTSEYANVYIKTTLRECLRAGLPPGFPSTAPPPVHVSAVLGTLAVWIPNQTKKKTTASLQSNKQTRRRSNKQTDDRTPFVCVLDGLEGLAVWWF